jgi:general secretion pathway protein E
MSRRRPPQYEGNIFCSDACLQMQFENTLTEKWRLLQTEKVRRIPRPKLGAILMQSAFITRDQLDEAIKLQNEAQEGRLGEWLLRLGFVEEHQITAALARQYGLPLIKLNMVDANAEAVRMIPGKVARCSGLVPVGFDNDKMSLRVAVTAPVNFSSQEAIRRMLGKGIVPYVGDPSAIQKMLEKLYEPEDLDLSDLPTFSSLEDLIEVGNEIIATAIRHQAQNIRAELVQEFFWVRLDLPTKSHHHLFRYLAAPADTSEQVAEKGMAVGYRAGR